MSNPLSVTAKSAIGTSGNDIFNAIAQRNTTQIHIYAKGGDDIVNIDFSNMAVFSHGHHVRGDDDISLVTGSDTFNFTNLDNVSDLVVGRIEDFDAEADHNGNRDIISIDGTEITLAELEVGYGATEGYDWKVVEFDADPGDSADSNQQWFLIDTGPGYALYALEGARAVVDGVAGGQEVHFIGAQLRPVPTISELDALQSVGFVDPQNYIPAGYTLQGGERMLDDDDIFADVAEIIEGTINGDLIAAGLNDDVVRADSGNDGVWGGSGNDDLKGQGGNDSMFGGTGDDFISSGTGNDLLEGGTGNDSLSGNGGADTLYGGDGDDNLKGGGGDDSVYGEAGNDYLTGGTDADFISGGTGDDYMKGLGGADTFEGDAGNDSILGDSFDDLLNGGADNDNLKGGGGDDTIVGGSGNDYIKGGSGADVFVFSGNFGNDRIVDFMTDEAGEYIDLSSVSSITSFNDLASNHVSQDGSYVLIDDGNGNTIRLYNVNESSLTADDFIF